MNDSGSGFAGVAARIVRRLGKPCIVLCVTFVGVSLIRAAVHVHRGGEWPEFRLWLDVMLFGTLFGMIVGCAAKEFRTEGRMRADAFGVFGLILGLIGVTAFYFVAPTSVTKWLEPLEFAGEENGGFILIFMGGSAIGGIVGMFFGEAVRAILSSTNEVVHSRQESKSMTDTSDLK